MDQNNKYTTMQRDHYNATADIMAIENHRSHDLNPDYYDTLLQSVKSDPKKWTDKCALDFGCGIGRNVDNLLRLAPWARVDGCDISKENIYRADKYLQTLHTKYKLYTTTGIDLHPIEDAQYDFVMSTIVLQHIAVHDIRMSILKDIFRVMKAEGLFSFQMAQYRYGKFAKYHDNTWEAGGTNGAFDVSVDDVQFLVEDLHHIGFADITYAIKPEWDYNNKRYMDLNLSNWIYVEARKP